MAFKIRRPTVGFSWRFMFIYIYQPSKNQVNVLFIPEFSFFIIIYDIKIFREILAYYHIATLESKFTK